MHVARELSESDMAPVREELDAGRMVLVPTESDYRIAARADDQRAVAALQDAAGRPAGRQTAVVFASVDQVLEYLPQLGVRATWAMRSLLPGPWTLVVDNPAGLWPWLTGQVPGPIGVRVPAGSFDLPPIAAVAGDAGNGSAPTTLDQVDERISRQVGAAIDRGPLPAGIETTVLDIVAWTRGEGDVKVLRDAAGRAGQALAVLGDAP
jgi:L-threonylcarbamoyladenylate synthase